jgi:ferredoxin
VNPKVKLTLDDLAQLLRVLTDRGYQIIGPSLKQNAIVYQPIAGISELPTGWEDEEEAGTYRMRETNQPRLFGYTTAANSFKKYVLPVMQKLWSTKRTADGIELTPVIQSFEKIALLGIHACDLRALGILDKVLLKGSRADESYKSRRENIFVIAVNCSRAGATCFCASMKTGPRAVSGFDLALTEITEPQHCFITEIGSEKGAAIMDEISHADPDGEDEERASQLIAQAESQMGRSLNTQGLKELLYANSSHPEWERVGKRCLTCGNCTLVCPTCFCTTIQDETKWNGEQTERYRTWDSCFSLDFTYIHGGSVRTSAKSRYRHWVTHKLATWQDQFGTSGCVGCGRCITWCPVGIDFTEELRAIASEGAKQ